MKKAYIFPGQGAQFQGMGKALYEENPSMRQYFDVADDIVGFDLKKTMFEGDEEELKQTKVTQPAVFLFSYVSAMTLGNELNADATAGHSLGEFTALAAANVFSFEEGLLLVRERATAMQEACEKEEGTMAAILGLEDKTIEEICSSIDDVVVPANYNCPGQLVISGSVRGVNRAIEASKEQGARRALPLKVGGAFHSPLMQSAREQLQNAIEDTNFRTPECPVYQNVTATASTDPKEIRQNLIEQLTAPVRWAHCVRNMISDDITDFTECGGKVLRSLMRKIDRSVEVQNVGIQVS